MQIQNLFVSKKISLITAGCGIFLLCIIFVVFHGGSSGPNRSMVKYSAPNNAYSFSYPKAWMNQSAPSSLVATIGYTVGGKQYAFEVSPLGQSNPEGVPDLTQSTTDVSYGGRQYSRTVWSTAGKAFDITATPKASTAGTYYAFSMQLPPNNFPYYEAMFDQIAASVSY